MPGGKSPRIPLPNHWTKHVRSAVLHVISLAQYAMVSSRRAVETVCQKSPKYRDEPSWRTRHKLQFSSERLRSMLRGIDTVLTG